MKFLDIVTLILVIVGGLNWGLWGAFQFDLVAFVFGGNSTVLARVVYVLVGLSAVFQAVNLRSLPQRLAAGSRRPAMA